MTDNIGRPIDNHRDEQNFLDSDTQHGDAIDSDGVAKVEGDPQPEGCCPGDGIAAGQEHDEACAAGFTADGEALEGGDAGQVAARDAGQASDGGQDDGGSSERSFMARMLIGAVRFYQKIPKQRVGGVCRFTPTCSRYALDALEVHGAGYGTWLTIKRLLRCRPLGPWGFDPIPPPRDV